MPLLRLLTSISGSDGVEGAAGDLVEVPERIAKVWADGVRAERVERGRQTEQAVAPPMETAARSSRA